LVGKSRDVTTSLTHRGEDVGTKLLAHAEAKLKDSGCAMITSLVSGPKEYSTAYRKAGFWRLPKVAMPHGIHFCVKDLDETQGEQLNHLDKWFLSWSDHDVV